MKSSAIQILNQIESILHQVNKENYSLSLSILMGNSIGKHVRHILDLFECLLTNSENEIISYDSRTRNPKIELSPQFALQKIEQIKTQLQDLDLYQRVQLQQKTGFESHLIETTIQRELLYNIEHAVHHMAIIRIGIEQNFDHIVIPENFGIAYSTIEHRAKT